MNPKSQKGRGTRSPSKKPTCGKCGKKYYGDCLVHFNALRSRGEQESSPDVVTGMLQVFSIYVYALLDRGDKLSFVTPLIAKSLIFCPIF